MPFGRNMEGKIMRLFQMHKKCMVKLCLFATVVLGGVHPTLAQNQEPGKNSEGKMNSVLTHLISALHSASLKAQAREQAGLLMSRDLETAKAATDFFHDLRAKEVLLYGLETNLANFTLQAYIADALSDVTPAGDISVARSVTHLLESTKKVLISGGTENAVLFAKYQRALVQILEKASNQPLSKQLRPFKPGPDYEGILTEVEITQVAQSMHAWTKD